MSEEDQAPPASNSQQAEDSAYVIAAFRNLSSVPDESRRMFDTALETDPPLPEDSLRIAQFGRGLIADAEGDPRAEHWLALAANLPEWSEDELEISRSYALWRFAEWLRLQDRMEERDEVLDELVELARATARRERLELAREYKKYRYSYMSRSSDLMLWMQALVARAETLAQAGLKVEAWGLLRFASEGDVFAEGKLPPVDWDRWSFSKVAGTLHRLLKNTASEVLRMRAEEATAAVEATSPAGDVARCYALLDWLVRTYLPSQLLMVDLSDDANAFSMLPLIDGPEALLDDAPVRSAMNDVHRNVEFQFAEGRDLVFHRRRADIVGALRTARGNLGLDTASDLTEEWGYADPEFAVSRRLMSGTEVWMAVSMTLKGEPENLRRWTELWDWCSGMAWGAGVRGSVEAIGTDYDEWGAIMKVHDVPVAGRFRGVPAATALAEVLEAPNETLATSLIQLIGGMTTPAAVLAGQA